jgi:hypothetical protein
VPRELRGGEMVLTKQEIALFIIAITLILIWLFGIDVL